MPLVEEYCLGAQNPGWKESSVVDRHQMHHHAHLVCMAVGFDIIGEFIPCTVSFDPGAREPTICSIILGDGVSGSGFPV